MQRITIPVQWMHCRSCELTLEKSISKLHNVKKVNANQSKWVVEVEYTWTVNKKEIEDRIIWNWYKIWQKGKLPWFHNDLALYFELFAVAFLFYIGYLILQQNWIDFSSTNVASSPTLWVVLIIWLTAWVSSCMALVGWLVLAVSAKLNQGKELTTWRKFYPHIYFNIGRVVWFWIFGAILWALWSVLSMSIWTLAILTLLVGLVMFLLGVNLTEISPRLANISITLPKFLSKNLWENENWDPRIGALITWALTFFLPCWFTLAMQMYAMSSWSPVMWALVMATFALWTAPWLIGIWWFTSIFKWAFAKRFFRYVWVLVILLGLFNILNSWNLLKTSVFANKIDATALNNSNLEVQEVRIKQLASWYSPSTIYIKPWRKIRLIVESANPYSCSSRLVIPSVWINKQLEKWDNTFEFVSPSEEGKEIPFSCIMWMYTWKFVVKNDWNNTSSSSNTTPAVSNIPTSSSNSNWFQGCNMMGWRNQNNTTQNSQTQTTSTTASADAETINMQYTSNWLQPSNLNLKAGKNYKLVIDAKVSEGWCMSTMMVPGLDENVQYIQAWTQIVFNISPKSAWQYPITCAMWVPHGYILVQ